MAPVSRMKQVGAPIEPPRSKDWGSFGTLEAVGSMTPWLRLSARRRGRSAGGEFLLLSIRNQMLADRSCHHRAFLSDWSRRRRSGLSEQGWLHPAESNLSGQRHPDTARLIGHSH